MSANAPFIFQVNKNDLGTLFVDLLKLEWSTNCPFAELLGNYKAGSGKVTDDLKEIAENETCKVSLSILANPLHRTVYNTGGGVIGVSCLNVYSNCCIDNYGLVSVAPSFENSIMVNYFDLTEGFAQWFVDTVSMGDSEEGVESCIPIKFPLESLVFVLHAIDCFKRIAYKSMLDYKPAEESMVSSREYGETLKLSAESKDARWLLPAFSILTPNLDKYKMNLGPDYMKILTDNKLLVPIKKQDTGEEFFQYSEEGRKLGIEFYSSWMMGIGFESVLFQNENETVIDNGFLAPTAAGNHLFLVEKDSQGNGFVNYSLLGYDDLISKTNELMKKVISGSSANAKAGTSECTSCGSSLGKDSKFCAKCGAKA